MLLSALFLLLLLFNAAKSRDLAELCNATYVSGREVEVRSCDEECVQGWQCFKGTCCPLKEFVCSQRIESGRELEALVHTGRFGYDSSLGNCIKFSFFGSGGNLNNFRTYRYCKQFCAGDNV